MCTLLVAVLDRLPAAILTSKFMACSEILCAVADRVQDNVSPTSFKIVMF